MGKKFFGKYRGLVTDVKDPLILGRIKARVPQVLGEQESGWALPCLLFGGRQMGFFVLPEMGTGVWIEFEQGDPAQPIWVGSWFASNADMPSDLMSPPYMKTMIMTKSGHSITIDDSPGTGGITLKTVSGQKMVLAPQGIEIDNGQRAVIKLRGKQVTMNNQALKLA